jgi:hypothetical protein
MAGCRRWRRWAALGFKQRRRWKALGGCLALQPVQSGFEAPQINIDRSSWLFAAIAARMHVLQRRSAMS